MISARVPSVEDIRRVVLDDEIYDRITDDNCPPKEEFIIPDINCIGGYVRGEIASLFIVHDGKMHFMVLREYRRHARQLLDASFALWPHNVYVVIPGLYMSVINFAKNYGFKEVSIERGAHAKNGVMYDLHRLEYEV